MNAIVKPSTLSESLMLVSLNVRMWSGLKNDKKISSEVERQHSARGGTIKTTKLLVPKQALEPVVKAAGELRRYFQEQTLPWLDSGIRAMPSMNYQPTKETFARLMDSYDAAKAEFVRAFPQYKESARLDLGSLYSESDYPRDIADAFSVRVRFMPLADPSDFRVKMADSERLEITRQIAETMEAAKNAALADIWARVSECVTHMADRLRAYKVVNGKTENTFRDSLVENLRDLVELIPRLNFANDPGIEKIRKEIEAELLRASAQELRDDFRVRESVAKKAEEIAAAVSEFMA